MRPGGAQHIVVRALLPVASVGQRAMSVSPPAQDFAFTNSPFVLPEEYDSKEKAGELESEQQSNNKRVRVQQLQQQHPSPWQHQPFGDDDLPSPAPQSAESTNNNHTGADDSRENEESKDEHRAANEQTDEEHDDDGLIHIGNKRRRPPPVHTPPQQPVEHSLYSPPPELEGGPDEEEKMDEPQPSYTHLSNEVSNEATSSADYRLSPPARLQALSPSQPVVSDEPIDLTDEDEVLPTPILPISLPRPQQQQPPPQRLPPQPHSQPAASSVPFHTPHGSWNMDGGRAMHPSFSSPPSFPSFPPYPPPAHPHQPSMASQPPSYQPPYSSVPRSHSEHSFPPPLSSASLSPVAPVPYSMVSSSPVNDEDGVVDLTDDADIEGDMQRLHVPLPSTTPSPPLPPQQHYPPPSHHQYPARPADGPPKLVKEEISLLDDDTEERFGSMLAFIRPTHPLPNMKLNSPVNIYEYPVPGDPSRMRATTDNEEDIGLLNVEASHALCPLLAHRRINIESRVLKIDAVSSMITVRVNVYGSEQDKAEINHKIHQYCPLHYFDSKVADQYINAFARQQQQPSAASQQFNPAAMQQVQPYISQAFSGPSISELEQHLDSVFSTEDQRKGYDIDIANLHMPRCIATEMHEYQKQGLVWMQGREQLKPEWKKKKRDANKPKRDPFTGLPVEDDEDVEVFLIWERRTKNGRVRYWNRAKNKFQASEPVFAKGGILADDMGLGKVNTRQPHHRDVCAQHSGSALLSVSSSHVCTVAGCCLCMCVSRRCR